MSKVTNLLSGIIACSFDRPANSPCATGTSPRFGSLWSPLKKLLLEDISLSDMSKE